MMHFYVFHTLSTLKSNPLENTSLHNTENGGTPVRRYNLPKEESEGVFKGQGRNFSGFQQESWHWLNFLWP